VRLRGPCGAQFEFTLAAIAQNLQACQVGRPATTTRPCVLCVTLQASVKSSVSRPAQSSGWQRTASTNGISRPAPSVCRLLQQNLPTRDSCTAALPALFNHLVGGDQQARRHSEAECLCGLEIDHHLELVRLFYRQVSWLSTV